MAHRLLDVGHKAFIAVAPAVEDTLAEPGFSSHGGQARKEGNAQVGGGDVSGGAESSAAEDFAAWLIEELGGPDRWAQCGCLMVCYVLQNGHLAKDYRR